MCVFLSSNKTDYNVLCRRQEATGPKAIGIQSQAPTQIIQRTD